MNIIQLHERVRFWLDTVGSARFEPFDIDNAINAGMNDIVDQKYQGTRSLTSGNSFQRTQKLRDELSNIIKKVEINTTGSVSPNLIPIAGFPADYKYLAAIACFAGKEYNCWPLTYDRLNEIQSNPYRRPRLIPFAKQYYIESSEGIYIYHSLSTQPTKGILHYISLPIQWKYGIDYTNSKSFVIGNIVIANSDVVVYNGSNYLRGDAITIVTGHLNITSGTVNYDYVNSNINLPLHEEIARKAAINALISIKEFDKSKALIEHFV
jgi:hypothetical protein